MNFRKLILGSGAMAAALTLSGCTTATNGGDDTQGLTSAQQTAATTALSAIDALGTSVSGTQGATSDASSAKALPRDLTCPTVTFTARPGGEPGLSVALDFGTGCSPLDSQDYICTGNITGTINRTNKTLSLVMQSLGCGTRTVSGSIDVTYTRGDSAVSLDGNWNLSSVKDGATTTAAGAGAATFNRDSLATTVTSYNGALTRGGKTYQITMSGIQVSFIQFGNFVPFAGSVTISTAGEPDIVISFDANSPTTRAATVTIGSLPAQSVVLP